MALNSITITAYSVILQVVPYCMEAYFNCVALARPVCDFHSSVPDFDSRVSLMVLIVCSSKSPFHIEITSIEIPGT